MVPSLPPEILALIFEWCMPCESEGQLPVPNMNIAPLLLGRISRSWRNVVLSTPSLWCSLRLRMDSYDPRLALLQTWLSRSGCMPLTLDLYCSVADGLIDVLRPHALQFESLRLCIPAVDIVSLAQWSLPLLQRLDIRWSVGTEPRIGGALFGRAPALREFVTTGAVLSTVLSRFLFPWAQLKRFECERYSANACLEILRLASLLEYCAFSGQYPAQNEPLVPISSHPNLRTLSFNKGWDDLEIIRQVQFPGLKELRFTVQPYSTTHLASAVSQCPSILRLHVTYIAYDETQLIEYLRSLPSLVDLRVDQPPQAVLLALFTALAGDSQFLPKLEILRVECEEDRNLYPSLVKMLSQRRAFQSLKSASFDFQASVDTPDKYERSVIAALRREGIDVRFTAQHTYGGRGWMNIL
ncbi:hypothetical protein B0H11DRAFT_234197 [Mycena galericulata]|nr:hypothetical protein B0H11DRAFT_234197 [Mycena galericulata]